MAREIVSPTEACAFKPEKEGAARALCAIVSVKYSLGYAYSIARMVADDEWAALSAETGRRLLAKRAAVLVLVDILLE
jgi:hypothetical protein